MHLAFSRLGWSPQTFWAATLPELSAALLSPDARAASGQLAAVELAALMRRFPD
ncbi:phage tail assembly chaperone [Roseibium limicola]|uniref:Phage tail assembly chaperone n=1 Tax=Roseibium limicola TaxID=2816037 RepID=A0A939ENS1_9HYPH|nr:phage tail assembly chaperone [Roseibium limicola]MBO0345196.1 phage tail assembly chaperone [Roseibium limicola]